MPKVFLQNCITPSDQQERTGGKNYGPFIQNAAISKVTKGFSVLVWGNYSYWEKDKRLQEERGSYPTQHFCSRLVFIVRFKKYHGNNEPIMY